ncbi:EAL domain-containing protein, partial [Actinoplanes sp. NPDC051411]|uniref:EAL domain-containing protein n=1 Tax=Actinoplanes sp. NPDC051411 TaxID=3155522 RepID=UPI00341B0672
MRHAWWWRWWLAGGLAAVAGYFLLPVGGSWAAHTYEAIGLTSSLAILLAVRLHRPARPAMWYCFAAGQLMSVFGDFIYDFYADVLHQSPYPSIADVFYLASYPVTFAGLVLLARRRTLADLLNAAIVATGLGLAFWIFVLHPIAAESTASSLERLVSITYPTVDLLLLAALAGQFTAPGGRTPSTRMLGLATALVLAADVTFSVMTLYSGSDGHPADAGFLLSYVFWAAAALHPSMGAADSRPSQSFGRLARLIALGGCSLLAPALLLLPRVSANAEDRTVVTIGAIVLFLLVITRMGGVMTEVQRIALHDALTGLANRRRLEQAAPARLIVLGLSGFKNINDELGRPVGDRVLNALAERLRSVAPGLLVARIGGDEFAVVPGPSDDDGALAERLGEAVRRPVTVAGHELLVGVGIGLSSCKAGESSVAGDLAVAGGPCVAGASCVAIGSSEVAGSCVAGRPSVGGGHAEVSHRAGSASRDEAPLDVAEVLRRAEVAMHAAKQTGESYKRWTPELDERTAAHARLGAELRTALDQGQFRVVYQPVVRLPEGTVHAVEALVRWEHPSRGLVSPAEFIPVAEQNGLIVELGAWILRTACEQMVTWQATLGDR